MIVVFNTAKTAQSIDLEMQLSTKQRVYPVPKSDDLVSDKLSVPALSFAIYQVK